MILTVCHYSRRLLTLARLLVQLALAALARWEGTQHSTWLKYARNLLDTAQWQQGLDT